MAGNCGIELAPGEFVGSHGSNLGRLVNRGSNDETEAKSKSKTHPHISASRKVATQPNHPLELAGRETREMFKRYAIKDEKALEEVVGRRFGLVTKRLHSDESSRSGNPVSADATT
jgi:hypothetical protein